MTILIGMLERQLSHVENEACKQLNIPGKRMQVWYRNSYDLSSQWSFQIRSSPSSTSLRRLRGLRYKMAKQDPPQQKQLNGLRFLEGSIVGNEKEARDQIGKRFHELMEDGKLFKDKFGACIGMDVNSKNFADELFDVLSKRRNIDPAKGITLEQLNEFYEELISTDLDTRIEIFFDLCDKNDDNKISVDEVKIVLEWTASANKLQNIKEEIDSHASLILQGLDSDGNGFIELEHIKLFIKELWYHNEDEIKQIGSSCHREDIEVIDENGKRILVFSLWSAINLGLFVWKFMEYMDKEAFQVMGYCVCFAKGSAETLKFNMGLILFLACRGALTKLRSSFLTSIFPFDDHIYYHMMVGKAIAVATFVHVIMHYGCGFPRLASCPINKLNEIIGPSFEFKQPSYSDFVYSVPGVTGFLMAIIMACCFILAMPSFRMSKEKGFFRYLIGFNAFWYSHHLLFLVYVLLILHGYFTSLARDWLKRTTWMYIVFPILFYASERRPYRVNIAKEPEPKVYRRKDLLALNLEKPEGFKYKSGMYLLINCPDISRFEWHPFSITSAPGDDYLSVHIRALGDWTEEIINKFDKERELEDDKKRKELESSTEYPPIFIRGPYGAPAQNYKDFDIVLLIGLGIGATPMISVLKDLLNHIKTNAPPSESETYQTVNNSENEVCSLLSSDPPKIPKKAYFYWVTNIQDSFDWFRLLMNDIANYDKRKVIEMHNHFSPMHKEGDVRSLFITILQNIQREKDIVSQSRIRARFGRPDWEDVFSKLESTHIGCKIGVFYCGSNVDEFPSLCEKHSQGSTKFHFHKENF